MKTVVMLSVLTAIMTTTAVETRSQSTDTKSAIKATLAYEVLIVKRAALKTELLVQRERFTSDHPDVQRTNHELALLNNEIERLLLTPTSQMSKLSGVYGDLLLRKIDLQAEAHQLRSQVTSTHPELRRKQIEIMSVQQEIEDLLR